MISKLANELNICLLFGYQYETLSITQRQEHGLSMYDNRILLIISGLVKTPYY
jgi:hypothetical protein